MKSTKAPLCGALGAMLFLGMLGSSPAWGQALCSKTTRFMELACIHEVKDDFWVQRATCRQFPDVDEVRDCYGEIADERDEARDFCGEQKSARNDLCMLLGEGPYAPEIDPANFLSPEDAAANPNPFFPLVPGNTWFYEEEDAAVMVVVTEDTREILGVECFAVRDVETEEDEVVEDTIDWYAQDLDGNVWYFGEISQEFEDGILVGVEGSWTAGEDGARPGILIPALPMPGDAYRQEFALGEAEDAGEIVSVNGTESVPAASCDGTCLVTRDFTPLEPDANENKYYAPGVGLILEVDLEEGGRVELVEFFNDGD